MIVRVDRSTTPASVTLDEPDDCKRFSVQAAAGDDDAAVAAALADAGAGRASDKADHVYVTIDAVKAMAAGQVPESWASDFDAMIGYASSKGWLDGTGSAIEAHIERG